MKPALLASVLLAPPYPTMAAGNVVTDSNAFPGSYWTAFNVTTGTDAAVGPDGTLTADKVIATVTSGDHVYYRLSALTAGAWSLSVFGKYLDDACRYIKLGNGSDAHYAVFDLLTGTVKSTNGGVSAPTIRRSRFGYWNCRCVVTVASTKASYIGLTNPSGTLAAWAGDGTSGALLWGAQLVPAV